MSLRIVARRETFLLLRSRLVSLSHVSGGLWSVKRSFAAEAGVLVQPPPTAPSSPAEEATVATTTAPSPPVPLPPPPLPSLYEPATREDYDVLKATRGMPLDQLKIKYLLQCRAHHPEVGGDPLHFVKLAEAYERILRDYGLEMIDGRSFNAGARRQLLDRQEVQTFLQDRGAVVADARALLASADPDDKIVEKPYRFKKNIFNTFFRRTRDAPTVEIDGKPSPLKGGSYEEGLQKADDLNQRRDMAGFAAQTATAMMYNVNEAQRVQTEGLLVFVMTICVVTLVGVTWAIWIGMKEKYKQRPDMLSEINADTLLPWWGNDYEYEKTTKRLYLEEWRRARASARRVQTFQEGLTRETLAGDTKHELDVSIFRVSEERLAELRRNAENVRKVQTDTAPVAYDKVLPPMSAIPRSLPPSLG